MLSSGSQSAFVDQSDRNTAFDPGKGGSAVVPSNRERTLLCVSPSGFSSALIAAIECEFRFLRVLIITDFAEAFTTLASNVDLILIDRSLVGPLAYHHDELASWHHKASIAILADLDHQIDARLMSLVEQQRVRGVLPVNINLDIMLSIFRILLSGGEYVPSAFFRSHGAEAGQARLRKDGAMSDLTAREWQILGHVAKGSQNKIIASDLGLSEHTVKIHIHNIINKLGVHNRTEAAAIYFAGLKGDSPRGGDRERRLS